MAHLTIVAHIHAAPDSADLVRSELLKLIPITRAEAGCIQYDLHEDNETPGRFMFYENWEDRATWQAHMKAPHLEAFGAATAGAVTELTILEMTRIG